MAYVYPGPQQEAVNNTFQAGGVQVVVAPVDYSENIRVLVEELARNVG